MGDIKNLIGSTSRDYYRFMHKQEKNYSTKYDRNRCKASDIDLVEIRNGKIAAFTDFKMDYDKVTGTEQIVYKELSKIAPVYIITSMDGGLHQFKVESFPEGHFIEHFTSRKAFFRDFIEKIETHSSWWPIPTLMSFFPKGDK